MSLLLGASSVQAEEVIFDSGSSRRAIGITDLSVNGTLYDVRFFSQTTAQEVYGPVPGVFDFDGIDAASVATDAVNAALNAAGANYVGTAGVYVVKRFWTTQAYS